MTNNVFDFAVIGAGIAGASVALELASQASVIMLERESQPGYHSTGRSAAMYIPSYGPLPIQALTKASGDFFENPYDTFGTASLLKARSELLIAQQDQLPALENYYKECGTNSGLEKLTAEQTRAHCPLLKTGYAAAGLIENSSSDIDVHTLHRGYLNGFTHANGTLALNSGVSSLQRTANIWKISTSRDTYRAHTIINAAGAWADEIGRLADAELIGLTPKRRTAITIELPAIPGFDRIPLTADIEERFYIKPDAGRLLISPANEDPMPPCDVQPEELEIAQCIDQIETAFDIDVKTIVSRWAGLRSFVADKCPVIGYSNKADNFFWLAGQGGYGIQSCPAAARFAASKALDNDIPADILAQGLRDDQVSVARLNVPSPSTQ